jgi:hypothetical protein
MRNFKFKDIYEKLEVINKNFENLVRAHYTLISMLIPTVKPTKREIKILKERVKEPTVSLKEVEKRLKNVRSSA